jgi:hypothetical protein
MLGLKKHQSHVQKALFLLVESGVFFFGLQVNFCFVFIEMSTVLEMTYHVLVSELSAHLQVVGPALYPRCD